MTTFVRSSSCDTGTCVEVGTEADDHGDVLVRNSTQPEQMVSFPAGEWNEFLRRVRDGLVVGIDVDDEAQP
jgi:hypothetical protein